MSNHLRGLDISNKSVGTIDNVRQDPCGPYRLNELTRLCAHCRQATQRGRSISGPGTSAINCPYCMQLIAPIQLRHHDFLN